MKKIRKFVAVAMIAVMGFTMSGCIGSFALTNKVLDWNKGLGNKFVQEVVFLGFHIIPVYEVTIFLDAVILNLVEFWTGGNPMALNEGVNQVEMNGQMYTVNVAEDHITIHNESGTLINDLRFDNNDNTWYSVIDGNVEKLMTINDNTVQIYSKNNVVEVDHSSMSPKTALMAASGFVAVK
ncbi:MAG: DUF3332 domain-containing protein [Salinivirgaceae bacterium]|jgi:hypothetical protein|nr:DUF3332 domain-containing protein [Bacteroidales bacterium]